MADLFPTLFVSHGAVTILEEEDGTAAFLRTLGDRLPRPRAILCVSADWETDTPTIGACPAPATSHDLRGMPRHLADLRYPAPGAVAAAADTAAVLRQAGIPYAVDHQRGFDPATWMPLMLMYPDAQIPVAQLSIQPGQGAPHHLALGRALAPLRATGVLIIGSAAGLPQAARFDTELEMRVFLDGLEADSHRPALPLVVAMGAGGSPGRRLYDGAAGVASYLFEGGDALVEAGGQRRSRLRRDDRERMILEEAIRFFCEFGLDGQTRALADRLGITQPLIYRYFPDKDALLARVFDELMARRWRPEMLLPLTDRSLPLADRLGRFVPEYGRMLCQDGWMRLVVSAGLKGSDFEPRFLEQVRETVVLTLCAAARVEAGLPGLEAHPFTAAELEAAWGVHAQLFFLATRPAADAAAAVRAVDAAAPGIIAGYLAAVRGAQSEKLSEAAE